ncbi:MAG TPA: PHP domain-containing protein [Acidimicrobiales bacterium]|nr:PHP domain-containing protein [Acidimicrobiales bacterium]
MLDYHVHLWPHAERADPTEQRLERLAAYCERAAANGVHELALTEHLFRFSAVRGAVGEFWRSEPDPALRDTIAAYFEHHATADLDEYVEAALAARAAGLPVVLGLEVDYYPGLMDKVGRLLAGYPFDVLLGSVHWLGTWMFDNLDDAVSMGEWDRRGTEETWRRYTEALEELAATKACDVLAHPDLAKVAGRRPSEALLEECHDRMAAAAAASGLAAEISSAGWRKPAAEAYPAPALLARFAERDVPVTTASDSHGVANVADRAAELAAMARAAGYETLRAFRSRTGRDVPISGPAPPPAHGAEQPTPTGAGGTGATSVSGPGGPGGQ